MRIQLPQPVNAPQVVALEISDKVDYNPTTGTWTFQVFGVSSDGDVSTLKVQALNGDIQRFTIETVLDSEIDAFLATPQGAGQGRSEATVAITLGKLYAFVMTPPVVVPVPDPVVEE